MVLISRAKLIKTAEIKLVCRTHHDVVNGLCNMEGVVEITGTTAIDRDGEVNFLVGFYYWFMQGCQRGNIYSLKKEECSWV